MIHKGLLYLIHKYLKTHMKQLSTVAIFFLLGCTSTKEAAYSYDKDFMRDELNKSIIEGFYNNDTTGLSQDIYLL